MERGDLAGGLAWMLRVAERYEGMARDLRALHARMSDDVAELCRESDGAQLDGTGVAVPISEAIRRVLAVAEMPLRAGDIWVRMKARRIMLRTRSADPRNLIDSTLQSMQRGGQVRRTATGWELVR